MRLAGSPLMELIGSVENLTVAWESVRKKGGCPGCDGTTTDQFGLNLPVRLREISKSLINGWYRPDALRPIYLPRKGGGLRTVHIATIRDQIAQRAFLNVLSPIYEKYFAPCSFAYRPRKGGQNAIDLVLCLFDQGYRWVLHSDIFEFFDSLPHMELNAIIESDLRDKRVSRVMRQWMAQAPMSAQGRGIVQGAVISPLMANIYLHRFDLAIDSSRGRLIRYSDDFLIMARSYRDTLGNFFHAVQLLNRLKLRVNRDKTCIIDLHENDLPFLGRLITIRQA